MISSQTTSLNVRQRWLIAISSLAVYGVIFVALYPSAGTIAAELNAIPAVVFGWLLGKRGGLYFPLFAIPFNMLLFSWVGNSIFSQLLPTVIGCGALTLVSVGIGWVRDLNRLVSQQAAELRAERQLLQEEIVKRKLIEERLSHEAFHDPLTNLPNRRLFFDHLEHAMAWSKRQPANLCAVLCLDLNRFKAVNDNLGHEAGDQTLIEVARRLRESVRDVDTVARMGGDEFAVLLEGAPNPDGLVSIIQRIQTILAQPYEWRGNPIASGASIGVVTDLRKYERIDEVLRDADVAMYQAKTALNNEFCVFGNAIPCN